MKRRIALSCTGEGFGHVARTVALAGELRSSYDVRIFCRIRFGVLSARVFLNCQFTAYRTSRSRRTPSALITCRR